MNKPHPCPFRTVCLTWERPQRKANGLKQRKTCDDGSAIPCDWRQYMEKHKVRAK